jgi:prepilin-type N-terminal cleavage/methylation domain-containing protein
MERSVQRGAGSGMGSEAGFTLIEVLLVASILAVVLGAILSLSATSQKLAPRDQEWAFTLRDAQVALHGMTRELRGTYVLNAGGATSMDATVMANGVSKRVVYDCNQPDPTDATLKQCVRYLNTGGVAGTKVVVIPKVKSASFTYEPTTGTPNFVRIKLDIPAKGERKDGFKHSFVLDDGVYLRNLEGE